MAVVSSGGALVPTSRGPWPVSAGGTLYLRSTGSFSNYEEMYREQPAVRTVVSFLGRNIAQLGLDVFRRISDTDRQKLADHPLALTLGQPMPDTTRYELIDTLVQDIAIWDQALWVKLRRKGTDALGLWRVAPRDYEVLTNELDVPVGYRLSASGTILGPEDVVHFRGYSPRVGVYGVPPMESLRQLLDEDRAATDYREQFWRTGARVSAVIKRPAGTPWSHEARERFRDEWRDIYSGHGPGAGGTPLLEDGMDLEQVGFNAEQSQYIEARKLTREEVAAAFHIPPPMVGILDHATFSNITEQHRNLYQDTLGPWLQMIQQRIMLRLLPDFADTDGIYVEFNLAEKMRGSFEEQVAALQSSVGAPWMTRNEARARLNLPSLDGGDELITPLNVLEGGQASPTDADSTGGGYASRPPNIVTKARPDDPYTQRFARIFRRHFNNQRDVILGAALAGIAVSADAQDGWDRGLSADLYELNVTAALASARRALRQAGLPASVDADRYLEWLRLNAEGTAVGVNSSTAKSVEAIVTDPTLDDPVGALADLFAGLAAGNADRLGVTQATRIAGYGGTTAARDAGVTTKTWVVTSGNPRPSHAAMNGQTVPVDEPFSNGLRWPGDGSDAAETAGCTCDLTYQTD